MVFVFDWENVLDVVVVFGDVIDDLYWYLIDCFKVVYWFVVYELVCGMFILYFVLWWVCGLLDEVLVGVLKGYMDVVLDDEFLLLMFFEIFDKKMKFVIELMVGI